LSGGEEDPPDDEPVDDEPPEDEPLEDEPLEDEPPEDEPLEDEPPEDEPVTDELLSPPLDDAGPLEDDELPELGDELVDPSLVEALEPEELPLLGDDEGADDAVAAGVAASPAELLPPHPANPIRTTMGRNCLKLIEFESKDILSSPVHAVLPRRQDLIFRIEARELTANRAATQIGLGHYGQVT
jgi:hypothetical protein